MISHARPSSWPRLVSPLATLIACAWLAGPATAQNALLYGRINLTLEHVSAGNPSGDTPSLNRLASNTSRVGFRGAEPLGGGLVALWQIESSLVADAGGGVLAGRETFVGLDGDWGTIKVGNFLTPYDDLHAIFGNVPTLTTSILSTAALWSQGTLSKAAGGFDARLANSIRYDLPEWRGLQGSVHYAFGEDARDSYVLGIGAFYTHESFDAGIAYERNHRIRGAGLNDWAMSVAAGWNFGPMRIAGVYERLRYATPLGSLSRNFYGASTTILAGTGSVYLFYGRAAEGKANGDVRVGGLASGDGSLAEQYEISYTYPLSQRTLLYAGYVRLRNDERASYNFAINPYTAGSQTGLKLNGVVAGIAHFF
ncbi:MAG TPA: porin [Casimicrobiaceae bacterium]|nr:porin [Casimicrobiaceae bacterium]